MILLEFLLLFIQLIFLARISMWFVVFINARNQRKWSLILITITYFAYLYMYVINPAYLYISNKVMPSLQEFMFMLIPALVIGGTYYMFISTLYNVRFKSGRQREFERKISGEGKSYAILIVISSIAIVASIFNALYYLKTEPYGKQSVIIISFIISGISLLLLGLFIFAQIREKKNSKKSMDDFINAESRIVKQKTLKKFILIIEDDYDSYFFKGDSIDNIKASVGEIETYYYISNYGIYKKDEEEYELLGVKTSSFDKSLLNNINLERFKSKEIEAILPYLEKNRRKVFELDKNLNPKNSFDA